MLFYFLIEARVFSCRIYDEFFRLYNVPILGHQGDLGIRNEVLKYDKSYMKFLSYVENGGNVSNVVSVQQAF